MHHRRLALCLRFSPAQNQFSSLSQTIKATCSFLQMTYCFQSGFGIFYGILKIKSGSQLPVSHFSAEREGLGRLYSLILPCGPVKAVINNFVSPNFRNVNSLLFGCSEGTKRVPPLKMTFWKGEARPVPAFKVGLSTFSAL